MVIDIDLLKDYICNYWSVKKDTIFIETTLDDLGMFGNDKYDFLIDYSRRFNVDFSNFNFEDYIEPEPSLIMHLDSFFRFFFKKGLTKKYDVKTITVKMLFDSIAKGKWTVN